MSPASDEITLLFTGLPATADAFAFGTATVALVRSAGRLIVFDTGPYAYRPILQGRLRRLGIDPRDVSMVVLSHLHWDSASNPDLFPNAEIVLHAREFADVEASAIGHEERPAYLAAALRRLRLRTMEGESELLPGIRLVELPGRTPGSIGLLLGRQLLAGDAVACARDAVRGRPGAPCADPALATESLRRALSMAQTIYPGHDRPFRVGPPIEYLADYELRIRLFLDPHGPDEELRISASEAKSFATWPSD